MSISHLRVVLVDINPHVVEAWQRVFADAPEVELVHGSILDQAVDAWVIPTNARGNMDGGLDAVIKRYFGPKIEKRVKAEIAHRHQGFLPVGAATCVPTGRQAPRFLISTPTMVASAENVSETVNVALACAAAFQAVHLQNDQGPGSIASLALPGLGASTGQVPADTCAGLMWAGYQLFREYRFRDFATMRATLLDLLGDLAPQFAQQRRRYELPEPIIVENEPAPWTFLGRK
jgi:O-acetyl-ADP-ribose deacetylase (regulator of RNase III)